MNPKVNPNRIEFIITYACTGKCKHCSLGDSPNRSLHIDPDAAANAVKQLAERYKIRSLMTFGGEPLLHIDAVANIHAAALAAGIPNRQIITNGFFTRDARKISAAADKLIQSGVNCVMISADAFHRETIPLEFPLALGEALLKPGINVKVHPAWLVSPGNDNPYNNMTREIIKAFEEKGIPCSEGNVIFPSGNALKYLEEYFTDTEAAPENPYEQDPNNIQTVSVEPDGSCLKGNILQTDILDIIDGYQP